MRMIMRKLHSFIALTSAVVGLLTVSRLHAEELEKQFPQIIPYELGASGFAAGDNITITSVRGDRKHIEPGGSYLVEGTYTLAFADEANLAFFSTSRGSERPTPIQAGQQIKITKGTGRFKLYKTNMADGWPHISFYYHGKSRGGVYFGEKGHENTVMRNQSWFSGLDADKTGPVELADPANRALLLYLGNPVPPPVNMDARYAKGNLVNAFTELCRNSNLDLKKVAVDDSEFPFLVYGIIDGRHSLPDRTAFEEIKGYTYGGSVRGSTDEGMTYFAVNMARIVNIPRNKAKSATAD